ncbi:hypothetical protein [Clostridium tyrobutyricum]|uniref:hypothetical protein n=1 Tax=Clostridium tyrobutyricum TaxID=1519 RepID=UPI00057CA5CB|nr:hypothetical protein [Clostridium tyrobutyricum]
MQNKPILSENLRKVNIIDDFWDVAKECRESYYYLQSLKNFLNNGFILKIDEKYNEQFKEVNVDVAKISKEIESIDQEFTDLENPKDTCNEPNSYQYTNAYNKKIKDIKDTELLNLLIRNIELREKIDEMQIKVLDIIIKNRDLVNKSIINNNQKLDTIYIQCIEDNLMTLAFNHSTREDKIDTYELFIEENKIKNSSKEIRINLPYRCKVRDYSYIIKRKRYICKNYIKLTLKLVDLKTKVDENEEINKLNKKQYYFNKLVTILTIISTLCAILSIILA